MFFSHGYQDQPKPVYMVKPVPTKLSPFRLYFNSRLEELLGLGKSEKVIFNMTHDLEDEYQMMPDQEKLKWIQLALEKTPAYMVYCVIVV